MEKRVNKRKVLTGKVMSDKMMKTRVVEVASKYRHAKYEKMIACHERYKAHDEKNESHAGDVVEIMAVRPLSKDKRWAITRIVKKFEGKEEVLA
jgi:small subunit ribosomal protein S17